jgi:Fimbrial assembly protein (PilN)
VRAVNLLPGEVRRTSRGAPQPAVLAAAVCGVVAVAVIGGGNLVQSTRVSSAQRALNAAKVELAATPLPPPAPKVTPPPAAVAEEMAPRLQAVSSVISTRIAWDRVLREFSLVLPTDVQLSGLTLTQSTGANGTATLSMSGETFSYDDVARLLSRLALVPDLSGVTVGPLNDSANVVSFSVNANVKSTPSSTAPGLGGTS